MMHWLRFKWCLLLHRKHHWFNEWLWSHYGAKGDDTPWVYHYCKKCNWGW